MTRNRFEGPFSTLELRVLQKSLAGPGSVFTSEEATRRVLYDDVTIALDEFEEEDRLDTEELMQP